MVAAMLLATAMKDAVKNRIDRTRPLVVADGGAYSFQPGDHDVSELDSFPSGHTAGAVAVAQVVAREYPAMRAPASITAVAIAVIQVPRGKHYPSDLLAGAVVGWAAEVLVNLGWRIGRRSLPRLRARSDA